VLDPVPWIGRQTLWSALANASRHLDCPVPNRVHGHLKALTTRLEDPFVSSSCVICRKPEKSGCDTYGVRVAAVGPLLDPSA
jgi:hypothetical protein